MEKLDNIIVFTDGACSNNGKINAKGGIGVYFPNKEFNDISEAFATGLATNQRTELYAIYRAIKIIIEGCICKKIFLYTDSMYSINCLTKHAVKWEGNNWYLSKTKLVKNLDIIKPLYELVKKYDIKFNHVKAHTKDETIEAIYNGRVDKLAKKACSSVVINNNNLMI